MLWSRQSVLHVTMLADITLEPTKCISGAKVFQSMIHVTMLTELTLERPECVTLRAPVVAPNLLK